MCIAPPAAAGSPLHGMCAAIAGQFLGSAHEGRDGVAERLLQRGLDPPFERRRIRDGAAEDHVAAGDECFDVGESGGGEDAAQLLHPHDVATDVDRAEKGYVSRHVRRDEGFRRAVRPPDGGMIAQLLTISFTGSTAASVRGACEQIQWAPLRAVSIGGDSRVCVLRSSLSAARGELAVALATQRRLRLSSESRGTHFRLKPAATLENPFSSLAPLLRC